MLDAAGSRRVVLFGASEGGPACIKFARIIPIALPASSFSRLWRLVVTAADVKANPSVETPLGDHLWDC